MSERTYRCKSCEDLATVQVMDPRFRKVGIYRPCHVPCICSAGERWAKPRGEGYGWRARYCAATMYRIPHGVAIDAKLIEDFERWLVDPDRRSAATHEAAAACTNYEAGFDRWNAEQTEFGF